MATARNATKPQVRRTISGRPAVEKINTDAITDAAAADVAAEVTAAGPEPADRLRVAVRILQDANTQADELRPYAKKLALSLALHEGARGVNVHCGVQRTMFHRWTIEALGNWADKPDAWSQATANRAKEMKVRFYSNAGMELPRVGAQLIEQKARADAALRIRDTLAVELHKLGVPSIEISEIIGRNPSRLSHIISKAG